MIEINDLTIRRSRSRSVRFPRRAWDALPRHGGTHHSHPDGLPVLPWAGSERPWHRVRIPDQSASITDPNDEWTP